MESQYYKGDKITTNGLSEQHVHEIKVLYNTGWGAGFIADDMGLTIQQVIYAINLNEDVQFEFDEGDFAVV